MFDYMHAALQTLRKWKRCSLICHTQGQKYKHVMKVRKLLYVFSHKKIVNLVRGGFAPQASPLWLGSAVSHRSKLAGVVLPLCRHSTVCNKKLAGCTKPKRIVNASRIPPRRPRTLRTWLGSARNFGNTRFGRFANFDFLTPKKIFRKKISENFFFRKKFQLRIGFSSFSADFGGARFVLTSKSDSWWFFASDGRILRPVQGLEAMIND